jgi:hypothetical protein
MKKERLLRIVFIATLLPMLTGTILSSCFQKKQDSFAQNTGELPELVDYNIHIKPIISDRCFACHGPDKNAMKAGLALYSEELAYSELEENPGHFAIVPGNIEESEVVHRIMTTKEDEIMPPIESNLKLNDYERELITKWIEQGAVYKPHWSFIPVEKAAPPVVKNEEWVSNPIDNFILSKMESKGLQPEEKASKEKLLRRASFDITGLPPTIEEIDNFLEDENEGAYEKVVDRLLGTISYAERMTSRWLDISRYADSHGYQDDFYRSMWPWREWVINAYNENKPFDEFLTWQIAGDLLPDATYEQKLATGFNRNHSFNQEGGIIKEEFRVEYVADRTNTLGASVLGLTLECARCHDHKYDPISQKNYYQLFGFYNSVPQTKGTRRAPGPSVKYPEEKLNELRDYLVQVGTDQSKALNTRKEQVRSAPLKDEKFTVWLKNSKKENKTARSLTVKPKAYFSLGDLDDTSNPESWNIKEEEIRAKIIRPKAGKYGTGIFTINDQVYNLGKNEYINAKSPFSISFWFYNKFKTGKTLLNKVDERTGKGFKIESHSGSVYVLSTKSKKDGGDRLISDKLIPDQKWVHLTFTYDGSGSIEGISLFVNGEKMALNGNKEQDFQSITKNTTLKIGPDGTKDSGMDEIYLFDQELNEEAAKSIYQFNPIKELLKKEFTDLSKEEQRHVADHYLYKVDRKFKIALRNLEAVEFKKLDIPDEGDVEVMTMGEMDEPNETFILNRGAYDVHGEEVFPDTPESILEFDESLPKNRLGLAQWVTDPKNPLTSRVTVNRYWQYLFGRGIVKTLNDFGNQGDLPSHPLLLDWLAATFMEKNWDTKAMIKLMVMSSTYQQRSATSDEKRNLDPENIYLSRGTRYRMPVEMIRDQALAASGLLNDKVGGPGVRPYQPDNLWGAVTGGGGGPLAKFVLDISEDLYRRSIYTFWKRTVPPPSMLSFDAATRDRCAVSRQSTNTPLQALALLNDPQYMEAARVMAQNIMAYDQPMQENVKVAFRKLTGRQPNEDEIKMLIEVYDTSLNSFKENPEKAIELLSVGDYMIDERLDQNLLAAHTVTFSTIFNLDETITKE